MWHIAIFYLASLRNAICKMQWILIGIGMILSSSIATLQAQNEEILLASATEYLQKKDIVQAKKLFEQLLKQKNEVQKADAYALIAKTCMRGRAFALATAYFEQHLRHTDSKSEAHINTHLNIAQCLKELGNYDSALFFVKKGLEQIQNTDFIGTQIQYFLYGELGMLYMQENKLQEADKAFDDALSVKVAQESPLMQARVYIKKAIISDMWADYEQASHWYEEAKIIYSSEKDTFHVAVILGNIGILYYKTRDIDRALNSLALSEHLLKSVQAQNDLAFASINTTRSAVYAYLQDTLASYQYAQQAFAYKARVFELTHPAMIGYHNTMANHFLMLGKLDSSLYHIQIALESSKKSKLENTAVANTYSRLADWEQAKGNYDKSQKALERGIQILKENEGTQIDIAVFYNLSAEFAQAAQNFDYAEKQLKIAFEKNTGKPSLNEHTDWAQVLSAEVLIESMKIRSDIAYAKAQKSKKQKDLQHALKTCKDFVSVLNFNRLNLRDKETALEYEKNRKQVLQKGLQIAYQLYAQTSQHRYAEDALFFAEQDKALILLLRFHEALVQNNAGIPQALISKQNYIESRLLYWKAQRNETNNKNEKEKIMRAIDSLAAQHEELLENLSQSYPAYHKMRFDWQTATAAQIREKLICNAAPRMLLEFAADAERYYAILIHQNGTEIIALGSVKEIDKHIFKLRKAVSEQTPEAIKQAEILYQMLIYPLEDKLSTERLIIIPEGNLALLPFEMLVRQTTKNQNTKDKTPRYWIFDKNIMYHYSATMLTHAPKQQVSEKPKHFFMGIAPTFTTNTDQTRDAENHHLGKIGYAEKEVKYLSQMFKGDYLLENNATETAFKNLKADYKVLHIATHAILDQANPNHSYLKLNADEHNDGKLYMYEIYNQTFDADLITLSACNTGVGQLRYGEGLMSLARAFAYSGSPNIVMSLWEAPDKSTSEIMHIFYKHIADGMPTETALRQAKIEYLKKADNYAAQPYYWATFVFAGMPDMQIIQTQNTNNWFWYVGMFMFAAFLLIFIILRTRSL
ncbi:MAG: CHAT domain-containing protein [Bernardetiaceae bacterium]|nr:CHAT domain-containing protein [Bernardetiaceae bacterium]